ncbi:MAG: BrnA antitoxin family protein [Desulfococcaceae bacterium]
MKEKYDFKGGRRGAALPAGESKERITIRLDRDILEWFRSQVEERGGGNYQTMINQALREHIAREDRPLEDVIRKLVREELQNVRTPGRDECNSSLPARNGNRRIKGFPERMAGGSQRTGRGIGPRGCGARSGGRRVSEGPGAASMKPEFFRFERQESQFWWPRLENGNSATGRIG